MQRRHTLPRRHLLLLLLLLLLLQASKCGLSEDWTVL